MVGYDRILVPVDGSDSAYNAAVHGLGVAGATGAAVHAIHVVDRRRRRSHLLGGEGHAAILREHGRKLLGDVERLAAEAGCDVETAVVEGAPHEAILATAAERDADLVVMGRRGEATVGQRLLGGVTDKVLRAGALPVLSVLADRGGEPCDVGYERVLVPTDGSDCAERAAAHGAALADLAGAAVHVVSVADTRSSGGTLDAAGQSEAFAASVEERSEEAIERLAAEIRGGTDRPVETELLRGTPNEALRAYVAEADVDAVVMGAHGRSGLSRWMLGSVTERLLRTVDVTILVVPGVD